MATTNRFESMSDARLSFELRELGRRLNDARGPTRAQSLNRQLQDARAEQARRNAEAGR